MRVHIKNIIASAISRGLIDGFDEVRTDLQRKKLTEDAELLALGKIGRAIWQELDDVIDFSDDEDDDADRKNGKPQMGFAATPVAEPVIADAISDQTLPVDGDEDDTEDDDDATDARSRRRSAGYRKQLETVLRSRPRRS